jgi:hypothetical protein
MRKIAFLVGNDTFPKDPSIPPLRYTQNDAREFAEVLHDPETCGSGGIIPQPRETLNEGKVTQGSAICKIAGNIRDRIEVAPEAKAIT